MKSKILIGVVFACTVTVGFFAITLAAPAAAADHDDGIDLPVPLAQRDWNQYDRDREFQRTVEVVGTISAVTIIITTLILLVCLIGPLMAVLIIFFPQIFPCKRIRKRRPGCGNCSWSRMTWRGYYRNRFPPQTVVVQVNQPQHQHQQFAGQQVPLIHTPTIQGSQGVVYAPPPQQSVYTSPSYPTNPTMTEQKQQAYNPNFSS